MPLLGGFFFFFFWSVCFCSSRIKWNLIRRSSVYNCQNDLQLKQCSAYMGEPRRLLIWMCNEKHPISCIYQLFNRPEVNTLILIVCDGFRLFSTSDLHNLSFMQLQPSSHLVFPYRAYECYNFTINRKHIKTNYTYYKFYILRPNLICLLAKWWSCDNSKSCWLPSPRACQNMYDPTPSPAVKVGICSSNNRSSILIM